MLSLPMMYCMHFKLQTKVKCSQVPWVAFLASLLGCSIPCSQDMLVISSDLQSLPTASQFKDILLCKLGRAPPTELLLYGQPSWKLNLSLLSCTLMWLAACCSGAWIENAADFFSSVCLTNPVITDGKQCPKGPVHVSMPYLQLVGLPEVVSPSTDRLHKEFFPPPPCPFPVIIAKLLLHNKSY